MIRFLDIFRRRARATEIAALLLYSCAGPSFSGAAAAQPIGAAQTALLIKNERPAVGDSQGWAEDILGALEKNAQPRSPENVCAVIAVASQESGFQANPPVANLGKLAEKELRKKVSALPLLGAKAVDYLDTIPTPANSILKRIRAARTERDLDLAYRALVDYAAQSVSLDIVLKTGALDKLIEDYNQISTIGSMQVSVAFALDAERGEHWRPLTHAETMAVRDRLYSRSGGLYYGARRLLDYQSGYDQKIFRFADYNAGRYSARNAALQSVAGRLVGQNLALDGDFLSYSKSREANADVTQSEKFLRLAIAREHLGIDNAALRRDLLLEKKREFSQTQTFVSLRAAFKRKFGDEPPLAVMPGIALKSAKITSKMTTAKFAQSVNSRYEKCMKAAQRYK